MGARPSAAQEAAKKEYAKAPTYDKPTARELAAKHGLSESTVHRADWYRKATGKPPMKSAAKQQEKAK
jgi:hypothetical protein